MKTMWANTLAWLGAVAVALSLAFAAPNETAVMGKLPPLTGKRLDQQTVDLPAGLTAERTLALIGFSSRHRPDIESWIAGLDLYRDRSIPWVRMPLLNDPGDAPRRQALEEHLKTRYADEREPGRVLAVVTREREAVVRAAGLSGTDEMVALVVNREGEVLARVVGPFDAEKAQALRETLQGGAL